MFWVAESRNSTHWRNAGLKKDVKLNIFAWDLLVIRQGEYQNLEHSSDIQEVPSTSIDKWDLVVLVRALGDDF